MRVRERLSSSSSSSSSSLSWAAFDDDFDDADFDDVPFIEKSLNFSSTAAFTAAVIFSMVGGESFLSVDVGFIGDFTFELCKR